MKQLDVQIMGQSYMLSCPEGGEAQLKSAVARVDGAMCRIRDAGKVRARDRIAVLAALNLAFDLDQAGVSSVPAHAPLEGNGGARGSDAAPLPDLAFADANRMSSLVTRLDAVLGQDGRLL